MIQDIAPLHLYNEWHNVQPEKDDWVICMQERKILVRGVQNAICFPRYAEIKSQVQNGDSFCISVCCWGGAFFSLSAASVQRPGRIESDASLSVC